jgi:hypothetical protein
MYFETTNTSKLCSENLVSKNDLMLIVSGDRREENINWILQKVG